MSGMRLLHVVPSYYPAVRYGGIIPAVHDLAAALAARGHDVHVYTTNVDGSGESEVPLGRPIDRDGVRVWYFPAEFGRRLYRSPAMGRALSSTIATFDVAHLHSVFLWPTSAAAAAARASGTPYVLAPHGMLVPDLIRRKNPFVKKAWIAAFEKRNVASAAAIHVTAEVEAEDLRALGLPSRRVRVIPHGVRPPEQSGETEALPQGARRPFVLFLGRVNWKKGLDRLIPAMTHAPGVDLLIAGNDEENYRPKMEALARAEGVAERVWFLGAVYGPAKERLLREALMLALPSYSENFAMVVLEAMAAGCPVVVTPEIGLATSVSDTGAGLVSDGAPDRFGAAMAALLADPDGRARMGAAGRRAAKEIFSWGAVAARMERLYRECIDARLGDRAARA